MMCLLVMKVRVVDIWGVPRIVSLPSAGKEHLLSFSLLLVLFLPLLLLLIMSASKEYPLLYVKLLETLNIALTVFTCLAYNQCVHI